MTSWLAHGVGNCSNILYIRLDYNYTIINMIGDTEAVLGTDEQEVLNCYFPDIEANRGNNRMIEALHESRINNRVVELVLMPDNNPDWRVKWQVQWHKHEGFILSGYNISHTVPTVNSVLTMADALPIMLAYVDCNMHYRFNNRAYEKYFKRSRNRMYGKHVSDILGDDTFQKLKPAWERALRGYTAEMEASIPLDDGHFHYMYMHYIPDSNDDGEIRGFYAVIQDVTEYKLNIRLLQAIHRIVNCPDTRTNDSINELLSLGRQYLDLPVGTVTQISHQTCQIQWLSSEDNAPVAGNTFPAKQKLAWLTLQNGDLLYTTDIRQDKRFTSSAITTYIGMPLTVNNTNWGIIDFYSPQVREKGFSDLDIELIKLIGHAIEHLVNENLYISRLTQEREAMASRAYTDRLTGLPSRAAVEEKLNALQSQVNDYTCTSSVAIIDLDFFKQVNDRHGHQAGDCVLRVFGRKLAKNLRANDFVGRIGGEEFMLMFPDTEPVTALNVLERLREDIANMPIEVGNNEPVTITMSACVTRLSETDTQSSVYSRADKALYAAKNHGRNQIQLYE